MIDRMTGVPRRAFKLSPHANGRRAPGTGRDSDGLVSRTSATERISGKLSLSGRGVPRLG